MKAIILLLLSTSISFAWSRREPGSEIVVDPAALFAPGYVDSRDELDRKIDRSYWQTPPEWSWVTEELRPVILERLLTAKADGFTSKAMEAEKRLIALGHAETIKEVMAREFLDPRVPSTMLPYVSDTAFPVLMPLVTTGSVVDPDGPGIEVSERDRAFRTALRAIENGHFTPETLKWAKKMSGHPIGSKGTEERIELLKEWWRNNEEAIVAKRPMEATWLPALFRGEPSYASNEELAERRAEVERRREKIRDGREVEHRSDRSKKSSEEPSVVGGLGWWVGAAVGVLIAAVAFMKHRGRSVKP